MIFLLNKIWFKYEKKWRKGNDEDTRLRQWKISVSVTVCNQIQIYILCKSCIHILSEKLQEWHRETSRNLGWSEDMELDGLKNAVSRYHISRKLFYGGQVSSTTILTWVVGSHVPGSPLMCVWRHYACFHHKISLTSPHKHDIGNQTSATWSE